MKKGYKCDFCSQFNEDKEIIEIHEGKCIFNPKTKHCFTCKHYFEDGYPISGHIGGCKKGINVSFKEKTNCNLHGK